VKLGKDDEPKPSKDDSSELIKDDGPVHALNDASEPMSDPGLYKFDQILYVHPSASTLWLSW
jgi:hypothetical protein